MATHEHRPATFSEGGKKTVRCAGCFEVLKEVKSEVSAAPTPEPVEIEPKDPEPAAPVPEPVDGPEDHTRPRRR